VDAALSYETVLTIIAGALALAVTWGQVRQRLMGLEAAMRVHERQIEDLQKADKETSALANRFVAIERNAAKIDSISSLDERMKALESRFESEMERMRTDVRELSGMIREMVVALSQRPSQARTKSAQR
jgi:predicted  nucleic acid-binding Zn-ribbon protein